MTLELFTRDFLLNIFRYDRETGLLFWKNHWHKNKLYLIGKEAGCIYKDHKNYYKKITLANKNQMVHQLIYFLETGEIPEVIDHIDGNGLNNRMSNLRNITTRKNLQNTKRHRNGKLVGAHFHKKENRWRSTINIQGTKITLGRFKTELEAHERYTQELKTRGLL